MTGPSATGAERFWDDLYQRHEPRRGGRASADLIDVAESLRPGRALDLGCGEGADAIWLAERGWRVTAVDIAPTALERAATNAAAAGVEELLDFRRHDLAHTFPGGDFDLVSAHYLHSPVGFPRDHVLRAAAGAVAPGGMLLVVEHGSDGCPTPDETLAALELGTEAWHPERLETPERRATRPGGESALIRDVVVAVRRQPPPRPAMTR